MAASTAKGFPTPDENSDGSWLTALARPLPLHGENAIDKRDGRIHGPADLHQKAGKKCPVHAGPQMPLGFFKSHDTAEQVFDAKG